MKRFTLLAFILATIFILFSCEDEGEKPASITGTWERTQKVVDDVVTEYPMDGGVLGTIYEYYEFNAGKRYGHSRTVKTDGTESLTYCSDRVYPYTYEDGILTLTVSGAEVEYKVRIIGTELKITEKDNDKNYGVFVRSSYDLSASQGLTCNK